MDNDANFPIAIISRRFHHHPPKITIHLNLPGSNTGWAMTSPPTQLRLSSFHEGFSTSQISQKSPHTIKFTIDWSLIAVIDPKLVKVPRENHRHRPIH